MRFLLILLLVIFCSFGCAQTESRQTLNESNCNKGENKKNTSHCGKTLEATRSNNKMRSPLTAGVAAWNGLSMESTLGVRTPTPEDRAIAEILREQQEEQEAAKKEGGTKTDASEHAESKKKDGASGGGSSLMSSFLLSLVLFVCASHVF
ncbi:uncharacterized protein TM35_000172250 [Trypanosoma theileri]|uniref:Uncharacterized protein n=1 Tax=Trypanosoma theileri TaxID=67003 RepID=A0A1X0NV31_9TRYP|nr:uncharacterized protein TM35_000172250 [Trypanosoma theileri]ORC88353.1 hypothetical protein TM35_000172250 [Trypanosoma theileri]